MSKTLEQLGIVDESKVFEHAGIDQDHCRRAHILMTLTDGECYPASNSIWGLLSPVPYLDRVNKRDSATTMTTTQDSPKIFIGTCLLRASAGSRA